MDLYKIQSSAKIAGNAFNMMRSGGHDPAADRTHSVAVVNAISLGFSYEF